MWLKIGFDIKVGVGDNGNFIRKWLLGLSIQNENTDGNKSSGSY